MREASRTPTRRETLTYGGALAAGGVLAGCSVEESGDDSDEQTDRYSAELAPVGRVSLDSPPESIFTRLTHHAGMAFALGRGNDVNAMHAPEYYSALWNQFTPRLPGVSVDWTGLYSSWEPGKEKLYELDSDIHLADPAWVTQLGNWKRSDIDEITENVAPWFGNSLSDRQQTPPEQWREAYEYYGLWEQFQRVAKLFGEQERYEALAAIHTDLLDQIEQGVAAASERPTVAMALPNDLEQIHTYTANAPGFLTAHTRPLDARNPFSDEFQTGAAIDIEALLEADPDVLLGIGGMHPTTDIAAVREALENNPVGSELSAVQNGRIYTQGARYQGPILNLFQLEMTAKQLYPDQFGEWPTYEGGPYPELPAEEQLFDRERVAAIIRGDADA